jgi:branched-chain amino acid transport system substrate-binding protein
MNRRMMMVTAAAALLFLQTAAQAQMNELVIGELHPMTGPAAYFGIPESQTLQLVAGQINSAGGLKIGDKTYKLTISTADTQANPTMAVAGFKKLITDNVHYIVGPHASAEGAALKAIVEHTPNTIMIADGAVVDELPNGKSIFRNQATMAMLDVGLTSLSKARNYPTVAFMLDRTNAGVMGTQAQLTQTLEQQGSKIAAAEFYKLGDTDFSGQLTKIASLAPSALFIRGYPAEATVIVRQARQLGFKGDISWETIAPKATVLKNISNAEMEGVMNATVPSVEDYATAGDTKAEKFLKDYRARWNAEPGEISALTHDSLQILLAAMRKAGSVEVDAVSKVMGEMKMSDVPELLHRYRPYESAMLFKNGQAFLPASTMVWKDGAWVKAQNVGP